MQNIKTSLIKRRLDIISMICTKRNKHLAEALSNTYYQIAETPLSVFISVICGNDLNALAKEDNVPKKVLLKSLNNLYLEFSNVCGTGSTKLLIDTFKKTYRLKTLIGVLEVSKFLIKKGMIKETVEPLKNVGVKASAPTNKNEESDFIKLIENEISEKQAQLEQLDFEHRMRIAYSAQIECDYSHFKEIVTDFSKHMGERVDKNKMTVLEFAYLFNEYNTQNSINNG